ncbi:Peroxisomal membrane protein LPX1 [Meyerozyma sp. JA9]|nr:Peroxisomal membrane protein LPX1 [Meyerozyma sp. JA9]
MSFTKELKISDAAYPRHPGGSLLVGQRLKISYNKYTANYAIPDNQIAINLIFAHGTGMNKAVWNYHITKLFEIGAKSTTWKLATVVSLDAVNHGDAAMANSGKLGWSHHWPDFGRDIVQVVKHEQKLWAHTFENGISSRNIVIGHSFGGFGAAYASFLEPQLFDSLVLIEPVVYHNPDPKYEKKFSAIFKKIATMLVDTFDSLEDYEAFFRNFSFYQKFHPSVLKDLMDDELYTVVDPETGDTKYKTKASVESQVCVYVSSAISLPGSDAMLQQIRIPSTHIVGAAARWNPPESVPSIRKNLGNLWKTYDIENGEHLLNGELPDETVEAIAEHIGGRVEAAIKNKDYFPELQYNHNPKKIFEAQYAKILDGQMAQSTTFEAPARDGKL